MIAVRVWWGVAAVSALLSAGAGLLFPGSYEGLFPPEYLPGATPQDILTVLVGLALLALAVRAKNPGVRTHMVVAGLLGGLAYLYGIFAIERVYNSFYLLYLATLASSFWSLVYGLTQVDWKTNPVVTRPGLRRWTAGLCWSISVLFTGLWVSALLPLMEQHQRIEFLYSIYILDLCFVMPALFVSGFLVWRRHPCAPLAAALLILGFFVIFPLALNEAAKPAFGQVLAVGPLVVSAVFSAVMLATAAAYLRPASKT